MWMRCRHTVPDWHRYVAAEEVTRPVLAACRLLIKEGEPAADARAIACGFWGRQRECPLYDGPESNLSGHPKPARSVAADAPVAAEHVWPVRQPGAPDGQRVLLMLLGGFSIVLLGWAVALSVAALLGRPVRSGYVTVTLIGGAVSLMTHVLVLLRLWIGR
jgi:hypothetical protein